MGGRRQVRSDQTGTGLALRYDSGRDRCKDEDLKAGRGEAKHSSDVAVAGVATQGRDAEWCLGPKRRAQAGRHTEGVTTSTDTTTVFIIQLTTLKGSTTPLNQIDCVGHGYSATDPAPAPFSFTPTLLRLFRVLITA